MIILAIDPSINHTGWAVLQQGENLVAGPPFNHRPTIVAHGVWRPKAKDPYQRLLILCNEAVYTREKFGATDVVIETTSGHVGKRHGGGGAGLALYGAAIGGLVMTFELLKMTPTSTWLNREYNLDLVNENLWTAGQPKRTRGGRIGRHEQALAEFNLPEKTTDHETDAINFGFWWLGNRQMLAEMTQEKPCPKPKSARPTATKKRKPSRTKAKIN